MLTTRLIMVPRQGKETSLGGAVSRLSRSVQQRSMRLDKDIVERCANRGRKSLARVLLRHTVESLCQDWIGLTVASIGLVRQRMV